ncbi:hypothetical protein AAG906_039061 [Vitis piasezkii]
MLHKAFLPLKYWSHAFLAAAYLINHLPTPVLKHQTPFESLFQQLPNYDKLRAFGCLCFPWLRYSNTHNAYKCLDLSSNRVYISRHVQFIEHQFPLASTTSPTDLDQVVSTWSSCSLALAAIQPSFFVELLSSHSLASSSPSTMTSTPLSVCDATPSFHVTKHLLHASLEPTTASQALQDPNWCAAMDDEIVALARNHTWVLVPSPSNHNIVGCKWVFPRLVAKGFHQRPRVDYHDTFSLVVKPTTIRVVLSIALSNGWPISQLDVNNAFLHGNLTEDVYMAQPPGYVDKDNPTYICRLQKALYGNCSPSIRKFVDALAHRFSLKDLGHLSYFLGVEAISTSDGMFLSQHKYVRDLLAKFHLEGVKNSSTLMSSTGHLTLNDGSPPANATHFRSLVGGLQYLQLTRPDIAFAINKLAQFMHAPTQTHWTAAKRLLRYLKHTIHFGLTFRRPQPLHLQAYSNVTPPLDLRAYSDADWRPRFLQVYHCFCSFLGGVQSLGVQRKKSSSFFNRGQVSVSLLILEVTWVSHLLSELATKQHKEAKSNYGNPFPTCVIQSATTKLQNYLKCLNTYKTHRG